MAEPSQTDAPRRSRLWRRLAATVLALAGVTVAGLAFIGVLGGNVHAVMAGRAYRSAQLSGDSLGRVIESDHIQTVINLRGGSAGEPFYDSEVSACRARGVSHVDVPLSASALPPPDKLAALLRIFDQARYPVLIHCHGGADRTGLASTLYLALYGNVPLDEAESRELTWRYGHFSFGAAHPMNDFFDLYRKTAGGRGLRDWILSVYPAEYARLQHHPAAPRGGQTG